MTKQRRRPKKFSIVKAVKANARERLGQPKPELVFEAGGREKGRKRKHKETLERLLREE